MASRTPPRPKAGLPPSRYKRLVRELLDHYELAVRSGLRELVMSEAKMKNERFSGWGATEVRSFALDTFPFPDDVDPGTRRRAVASAFPVNGRRYLDPERVDDWKLRRMRGTSTV